MRYCRTANKRTDKKIRENDYEEMRNSMKSRIKKLEI